MNNFGWRTGDRKIAVVLGMAGASVELRRYGDNSTVDSFTAGALVHDDDSGDGGAQRVELARGTVGERR